MRKSKKFRLKIRLKQVRYYRLAVGSNWVFCMYSFFYSCLFTDTDMEKFKDKFDDEITHVAMKTGLKKWHVVVALIGKFQDTEGHFLFDEI